MMRWTKVLAQDQREDVTALRAKRHADADFLRPLTHRMCGDAVDADAGEQQRDDREAGEQHRAETWLRQCFGQILVESSGPEEWQLRMQRLHLAADRRQDRGRLTGRAHDQHLRPRRALQRAEIDLRADRPGDGAASHIPNDSYYRDPWPLIGLLAELYAPSDRVLSGPGELREGFVDDRRLRRGGVVLLVERASSDHRDLQGVEESG